MGLPAQSAAAVNRISEALATANLDSSVPPVYPALASAARVQGSVVLQVEISIEVSGHALLNEAASLAVRQWTYKPFVLNGKAIPVTTTVTVPFTLP
jgi:protein TonB